MRGRQAFEADELIQSWIVRHLQIIVEAARALPEAVPAQAPAVPWAKIIGMRHILVHDYFGIGHCCRVGGRRTGSPPGLRRQIEDLLATMREP